MAKDATTQVMGKYYADGRVELSTSPVRMTLKEMQAFVGGYIEYVKVAPGSGRTALCVNGDGVRLQLPHNLEATRLVNRSIWMYGGIHGNALLVNV